MVDLSQLQNQTQLLHSQSEHNIHKTGLFFGVLLVVACQFCISTAKAAAPGEDTILLPSFKPSSPSSGSGAAAPKGGLDPASPVPAWLRAKTARYTAQAYAEDTHGVNTDKDIVQNAQTNGMSKTCTQEVGSNTFGSGTNQAGLKPQQQVVVLRGDLINVCK